MIGGGWADTRRWMERSGTETEGTIFLPDFTLLWSLCDAVQVMTFLCLGNEGVSGKNKSLLSQFFYLHCMESNKAAGNTLPVVPLNACLLKKLNMLQCSEYKIAEYIANVGIFLTTIL